MDEAISGAPDDAELLAAHVGGDPDAFAELVRRHRDRRVGGASPARRGREEGAGGGHDARAVSY
ncbi:RNA polymerase sigma factor SigM, partial [Streptomyces albidoflavus]